MDHTREILTEQAAQRRTLGRVERLLWRVLDRERLIAMNQAEAIALLENATTLITTLETEVADSLDNPAVASALAGLKTAVDAASVTPPATGDEDGSDGGAAGESDQDATTVTTPDGSSAE